MWVTGRFESQFPFLFGGTFIEGLKVLSGAHPVLNFPSFSEGLSLRVHSLLSLAHLNHDFPSFSEGLSLRGWSAYPRQLDFAAFPFLFGGTFIEGFNKTRLDKA